MRWALLAMLALALLGCERGCLTRKLADHERETDPAKAIDLGGTDCPDGLLRCRNGQVEASRLAHLSTACAKSGGPEKQGVACVCPWDVVGRCRGGCNDDEAVVITAASDAGVAQMCRPDRPVARPAIPSDDAGVDVCSDDGITCRDGFVRLCEAPAAPSRAIARCVFGCADLSLHQEDGDGPTKNPDGVIAILCRRDDAERR